MTLNLLETERLVRRINAVLAGEADPALTQRLAEDYATVCRASALRLAQCEAMIQAGNFSQALQLAESQPPLLDLVILIEFRHAREWLDHCRENRLPVPEPLDTRAVQRLNECYGKGIQTDDPLYRHYRSAVLTRDEVEAIKVLRTITRLNPSDTNAASELERLDRKVLAERMTRLDQLIRAGQLAEVEQDVRAIEAFGFEAGPAGPVWTRGQEIRCLGLIREAGVLRGEGCWRGVLVILDDITGICQESGCTLGGGAVETTAALGKWASQEREKDQREREHQANLIELRRLLALAEDKDIAARKIETPELKKDSEAIQRVWRALEQHFNPVPEELKARFRKRSLLLSTEIGRRSRLRVQLVSAGTFAALLIIGGVAFIVLQKHRATDLVGQLRNLCEKRQVRAAEKMLGSVKTHETRLAGAGTLSAAMIDTESFLQKEKTAFAEFSRALGGLPGKLGDAAPMVDLASIQVNYRKTTNLFHNLAPDYQKEAQAGLRVFQDRWEDCVARRNKSLNMQFEELVSRLERKAANLDPGGKPESVRNVLREMTTLMAGFKEFETSPVDGIALRNVVLNRRRVVEKKVALLTQALARYDTGVAALESAKSLGAYLTAIGQLADAEFSEPRISAARPIRALKPDADEVLASLLLPNQKPLWQFLKGNPSEKLVPNVVMPAEKERYRGLMADEAISTNLFRYRLLPAAAQVQPVEWVALEKLNKTTGWNKITAHSSANSPDRFRPRLFEYGFFDGRFQLPPGEPVVATLQEVGYCNEAASFFKTEAGRLTDPRGERWQIPLLKVLDAVKDSTDGSVIFRAYLCLRLFELMEIEPEPWGVPFAPLAMEIRRRLLELGADKIRSGDWLLPAKHDDIAPLLATYFDSLRGRSCWGQARRLVTLHQAALRAGFLFAGYVDANGRPIVAKSIKPDELWGYTDQGYPGLLFQAAGSLPALRPVNKPKPLSPLFVLKEARGSMLVAAGINVDDPNYRGHLPPLFTIRTGGN